MSAAIAGVHTPQSQLPPEQRLMSWHASSGEAPFFNQFNTSSHTEVSSNRKSQIVTATPDGSALHTAGSSAHVLFSTTDRSSVHASQYPDLALTGVTVLARKSKTTRKGVPRKGLQYYC